MIVIGQDSLNNGALLTIFDGKTDKFVKNPVLYTNEEFDEVQDLTTTFRMNDVCIVTTPKHQIKNLVHKKAQLFGILTPPLYMQFKLFVHYKIT